MHCDAKVANDECVVLRQEDVGWLDVEVDHAVRVDVFESLRCVMAVQLQRR